MFLRLLRGFVSGAGQNGRFAAAVVGAAAVSMVWLVVMMWSVTTPGDARWRRASPTLPPPTAALTQVALRQVTWHDCQRKSVTVPVVASAPPQGFRSVVTSIVRSGVRVDTGTELGGVAGQPVIAVVTDAVFYRDLTVGDHGPDVQGLEVALSEAGIISRADSVMDASTLSQWHRRFDKTGPGDRVRLSSLAAIPRAASVGRVAVSAGQAVKPGAELLEVQVRSAWFDCEVTDPTGDLAPGGVTFTVGGRTMRTEAVVVRRRGLERPGSVEVLPAGKVAGASGRLGVVFSASDGAVLAAPLSAIKTAADGGSIVVVVNGMARREVEVELGATAQGLVEVRGNGLAAGVTVELFDPATSGLPPPGGQ